MASALDREIAIIKMAREVRQLAMVKALKDGDGDGKAAAYPGGPDNVPVAPRPSRAGLRSRLNSESKKPEKITGPTAKRDAHVSKYGMIWNDGNDEIPEVLAAKDWPHWNELPTTPVPVKGLRATEEYIGSRHVDKVLAGEPLRSGYDPFVLIMPDGRRFIIDGHHRAAMYSGLKRDEMPVKLLDLRKNPDALKNVAKVGRDGDGDGKAAAYPGGPDVVPVAGASAVKRAAKKATKRATAKKPAAKSRKTEAMPGKMPPGDKVDSQTLSTVKKNPLFKMLFGPLPPDPNAGEKGSYEVFRRHHHERVARREKVRGKNQAGGGSTFVRFIPKGHKKGKVEQPSGSYVSGQKMELSEAGAMGEALVVWNPEIRRQVEDYFGAPIDFAEGQTLKGRVSNSTFDIYCGDYAIEIKTLNISANRDKYDMGGYTYQDRRTKKTYNTKAAAAAAAAGVPESRLDPVPDVSTMESKVNEAKKRGMRPALLVVMVDQESGRVWLMGDKNTETLKKKGHSYSKMDLLDSKNGGRGTYVSQDVLYSAWLFGLLKRPVRTTGENESKWKFNRKTHMVEIAGGPSKTYGSEMKTTTIQEALDQGTTPHGFV